MQSAGHRYKKSVQDRILDLLIYGLSGLILFITLYPFYYVFMLSFNDGMDAAMGGIYWFPRQLTLDNYRSFFTDWKWVRGYGVTIVRTLMGTVLGVIFTTLVAYSMSFKELVGRKYYMTFFIVCMYFSGGIIPYYAVLRELHLIDTFWVYIVPSMLNLFYIMVGRGFFDSIPSSLRESAMIDGAGEITVFSRIIIPISKPFMATMALFVGVWHWNNWHDTTFFVKTKTLRTLPYLLMEVVNQSAMPDDIRSLTMARSGITNLSIQMAAMVIAVVPITLIYPFLQKYFVSGMMIGAVKE